MAWRRGFIRSHAKRYALCALAVLFSAMGAFGAVISATVDRPVVTQGESITLTLSVEGAQLNRPNLPTLPGFEIAPSTGISTEINNGRVRQLFTYVLVPTQTGDLVIPGLQLNIEGQASMTQPIRVRVLKPGEALAPGELPAAFAKLILPKTNLYVGEVVEIQVEAYARELVDIQFPQLPADSGFTIGKWLQPSQQRVALSNQGYALFTFRVPITIVKAGALNIGPVTQTIFVPDRTRRSDFFFGQPRKEVRLFSEKIAAIALPLPSVSVPPTFAGAVGQFAVNANASPTNVAVGDPITMRIQVSGRGWLDAVTVPPQPQWRDFKMYSPNARVDGQDQNNVSGIKSFEIAVVPQSVAIKALPPFEFSFFDPAAAVYRTVSTPAIPLNVTASGGSVGALPSLTATNSSAPKPMSDIVHIKVNPGPIVATAPLITQPWFVALQFIAPTVWLGLLVRRKRAESLANNPKQRRRREVQVIVRDAIGKLHEHASANRSDEFFATLFRALQEQIGERLDVPANSVTEAVIEERLRPAGLSEAVCGALHELFQSANLARYAPIKSSGELGALASTAGKTLRELQQWEAKR